MSDYPAWRRTAARYRGTYTTVPKSFFHPEFPSIELDVGQVRIDARVEVDAGPGPAGSRWTVLRWRFVLGAGPKFAINSSLYDTKAGRDLSPELVLGNDPRFDELYTVHGLDLKAMRELFDAELVAPMIERPASVSSDGTQAELLTFGIVDDVETLEELLSIASTVGEHPAAPELALRTIPGAQYVAPSGPWNERTVPRAVLSLPEQVTIEPVEVGGSIAMQARVRAGRELELSSDTVEAPIAGEMTATLRDNELILRWTELPEDPAKLQAGARLAAQLVRVQAPYR